MKKKEIVSVSSLLIFLAVNMIADGIICFVYSKYLYWQEYFSISCDILRNITSMQISISLISITLMVLFLGSTNERIMGISYKKIYFNEDFLGFFNMTNCIFFMLIFMVLSILASTVFINFECCELRRLGKIVCGTALAGSILIMFHMINLGLILKYKQSRIYYIIYKQLENKNEKLYNEIIDKLDVFQIEKNKYQQYIIEEFMILSYIYLNINSFDIDANNQNTVQKRIIDRIGNIIENDSRDNYYLMTKLYKEAEKIFKKDKANELFWCNFYK